MSISKVKDNVFNLGSGLSTAEEIAQGKLAMARWNQKIFPILASKNKKQLNRWFDEFQFTFNSSQVKVNTMAGYSGYLLENQFAVKTGLQSVSNLEYEVYKELYKRRIGQLSTVEPLIRFYTSILKNYRGIRDICQQA